MPRCDVCEGFGWIQNPYNPSAIMDGDGGACPWCSGTGGVDPEPMVEEVIVNKKVQLELVGLDGNAFYLMGAFAKQARSEEWTDEEIQAVLEECRKSDYDHLLRTLMEHCESPEED